MINIKTFNVTQLATNCCYLVDEATKESAVTDPGDISEKLITEIENNGGKLDFILLTHGHFDHIGYAKQLADRYGAKIVTGRNNSEFLCKSELNLSLYYDAPLEPFDADVLLDDGDTFMLGDTEIKYISTAGHTSGCGVFVFDNTIISGDTLFCESYGRTDLPTGNLTELTASLKKLKELDGDYTVIPGHGEFTTLEHERKYNPIMRRV